jgi:membrane protein implicated in regulation of membrane protease activity
MTWADFYLACFLVGFLLTVVTLLLGHLHVHVHMPHGHGGGVHIGHGGHGHAAAGSHGTGKAGGHSPDGDLSPFNFATITVFLAWFGGAGYIVTRYSTIFHLLGLGLAVGFGLTGSYIVFWFLAKLAATEHDLDPDDYQMIGALGRVVSLIRQGETGEIIYVQGGTRQTCGARSEDGSAIAKQEEVVVTRYEKGIAYVRRWTEMAEEGNASAAMAGGNDPAMNKN